MTLPEVAAVRQASRLLIRQLGFLDHQVSTGFTHSECHAMIELERHGELTTGELSQLLFLDKSTMSRVVSALVKRGWVAPKSHTGDRRKKPLLLTNKGKKKLDGVHQHANGQVDDALALLEPKEREQVVRGIELYAKALTRARAKKELVVRPIEKKDDAKVAKIIRAVMPAFGACGEGFAINDAEVDTMTEAYRGKRAKYFVITRDGEVLGGAGFAPLAGGDGEVCELRKMYFLPELRGLGMGRDLLIRILEAAKTAGFKTCYLETLEKMTAARSLYESLGFEELKKPMGDTGHFSCDRWYARKLNRSHQGVGR